MFDATTCDEAEAERRRHAHALLDQLLDADPTATGPALSAAIQAHHQLQRVTDGQLLGIIPAWTASGDWGIDGSQTPTSWLVSRTGCQRRHGHKTVRTAQQVAAIGALATRAATGALPLEHLSALARVRDDDPALAELYDRDIESLATQAQGLALEAVQRRLLAWKHGAYEELARNEPDTPPIAAEEADRLSIHRSFASRGLLQGELSPESTAIVEGAIAAQIDAWFRTGEAGTDTDTRTYRELQADALVHICRYGPPGGTTDGAPRPLLIAVGDLDTICDRAGVPESERLHRRAEIIDGGPVADRTIRRLLDDADLAIVITDTITGEPLYCGRTKREATRGQRRALIARSNGTCEIPGCNRPHRRNNAHHIVPWDPDGLTDIDNLVDLCKYHHRLLHKKGITITRGPTGLDYRGKDGDPIDPPYRS